MTFRRYRKLQEFWEDNPPTDALVGLIATALGWERPKPRVAANGNSSKVGMTHDEANNEAMAWLMSMFPSGAIKVN